jgi:hypothetical protein
MVVQRKNVYRRLPLDHVGAENCISEHTIVRCHDRSMPLQLKMFFSNNYGKRSFAATETKVIFSVLQRCVFINKTWDCEAALDPRSGSRDGSGKYRSTDPEGP